MFGLINKLILCPRPGSSEESLLPRQVIIPQGEVTFRTMGDFTSISINTDGEQHVRWHEYTIDTDLGRLTSNTSLMSKLYQCYLHALTSHCLPDPLLGFTGTEEALYMLRSATCQSFQRLDTNEAKLLELVGNLTPKRFYYPPHRKSMATVRWKNLPALSQHHDFFVAVCAILDHAQALEALYDQPITFDSQERDLFLLNRAACRNRLYYPSDFHISKQPSSSDDREYHSGDVLDYESAEHVAYQISWSIWNAQPFLGHGLPELRTLMSSESWGAADPSSGGAAVSLRYSRHWLELDAARDWLVIYDLFRREVNGNLRNLRIQLSFCLSAATYSKSKYSKNFLLFIAFSLPVDERRHNLHPPPDTSYTFSDGVAPKLACIADFVYQSAKKAKKRRKKQDNAIRIESSRVAGLIYSQWPDYRSVDFPGQWFNKYGCHQRIEKYFQSLSRNIQLRDHVLQLLGTIILKHHGNVSIPTTLPYSFLPRFTVSRSKVPSYSLRDVLSSRTSIPIPLAVQPPLGDSNPPSTAIVSTLELVGSDNLQILIEEFQHSCQPLLEVYGNELNKSHCELMGHSTSQSAQGSQRGSVQVPSHELLSLYHDESSRRKDELFSEISATLAPSQNVEETNAIAGLWPRITPRTLLRQLAQDRIGTLPDEWKAVITHYAICLLKYQQSQRMLELSSSQKHEELLWETDSVRSDVLTELAPDWLLIQVRPICFRRKQL
jgi:hypothetical protein